MDGLPRIDLCRSREWRKASRDPLDHRGMKRETMGWRKLMDEGQVKGTAAWKAAHVHAWRHMEVLPDPARRGLWVIGHLGKEEWPVSVRAA